MREGEGRGMSTNPSNVRFTHSYRFLFRGRVSPDRALVNAPTHRAHVPTRLVQIWLL